jgi:hypothetical protein
MSLDYDFNASDLDEFLVEYVDGTMDPVVREAFEEFLWMYPDVAEQVDCLASVRSQLCRLGDKCRCHAPPGFQDRLKEHLLEESSKDVHATAEFWAPHLNTVALAFSLTLLVLAVGLSATVPRPESTESEVETVDEPRVRLETSLVTEPLRTDLGDFHGPITLARNSHWSVSHTHPGSGEVHVEAAFDRPILLSVRRDIIAMRPVSSRPSIVYGLP